MKELINKLSQQTEENIRHNRQLEYQIPAIFKDIDNYYGKYLNSARPTVAERKTIEEYIKKNKQGGSNVNQIARALNRRADSEELIGISKEHIENTLHAIEMLSTHLYTELTNGHTRGD